MLRRSTIIAVLACLTGLTAIAMAYVLMTLVNGVSHGANDIDEAKTRQAVQATLSGLFEQASGLIGGNANWDDAVNHVYGVV